MDNSIYVFKIEFFNQVFTKLNMLLHQKYLIEVESITGISQKEIDKNLTLTFPLKDPVMHRIIDAFYSDYPIDKETTQQIIELEKKYTKIRDDIQIYLNSTLNLCFTDSDINYMLPNLINLYSRDTEDTPTIKQIAINEKDKLAFEQQFSETIQIIKELLLFNLVTEQF